MSNSVTPLIAESIAEYFRPIRRAIELVARGKASALEAENLAHIIRENLETIAPQADLNWNAAALEELKQVRAELHNLLKTTAQNNDLLASESALRERHVGARKRRFAERRNQRSARAAVDSTNASHYH